jgi:DNA-directed RNA polymerase subunit E'/Rpb7
METEALFQEKVYLTPKDMRGEVESIDALLQAKLQEKLEQRCSPHGFVLPGTLELLTRSAGMVDSGRFSGDWTFLVKAKARVLHPPEGTVVEVEIIKTNKMGIYAVYENAIRLMVPRDLHLGDEEFDQLKVGDNIKVEIQKSRFQLRDPFIVSVGIYRGRSNGATKVLNDEVPELAEDAPEKAQEVPEEAQEAEEESAEEEEEEEETEE